MDGHNTIEPDRDQTETRTPLDIDHELKFTGFEQPKERGMWAFVKRHKLRVALASFTAVIAIAVGVLVIVSGGSEEPTIAQQPQNATQVTEQANDEEQAGEPQTSAIPQIVQAEYSLRPSGEFYELVSDGQVWLTRSERSWGESVTWNDWLFFASNRSATSDVVPSSDGFMVGIEAFNYETKEYLSLAELTPPAGTNVVSPMYIIGDYLYVTFGGNLLDGSTYRCKLSEQKSCTDLQLYYRGSGVLRDVNQDTTIAVDVADDGGVRIRVIGRFDPTSGEASKIASLRSVYGIGSDLVATSSDGLIWISEASGDEVAAEDPNYDGRKLERLYAIDTNGDTKFVLPAASFPIADAQLVFDESTSSVTYVNDSQEVIFDPAKKEFGAVKARDTTEDEEEKTQIRKLLDISTRLEIPVDLTLRAVE